MFQHRHTHCVRQRWTTATSQRERLPLHRRSLGESLDIFSHSYFCCFTSQYSMLGSIMIFLLTLRFCPSPPWPPRCLMLLHTKNSYNFFPIGWNRNIWHKLQHTFTVNNSYFGIFFGYDSKTQPEQEVNGWEYHTWLTYYALTGSVNRTERWHFQYFCLYKS